jgi:RimJ/RimL family protein N-acetyltransferase
MLYLIFFSFVLSCTSVCGSNVLENLQEGQQFHRTKAGTPIYLEKSDGVSIEKSIPGAGKRKGFLIKLFDKTTNQRTNTVVGYIIPKYDTENEWVSVLWIRIFDEFQGNKYAQQALQTLEGVYKKYSPQTFTLYLDTATSNDAMVKICKNLEYQEESEKWRPPFMSGYVKVINKS